MKSYLFLLYIFRFSTAAPANWGPMFIALCGGGVVMNVLNVERAYDVRLNLLVNHWHSATEEDHIV